MFKLLSIVFLWLALFDTVFSRTYISSSSRDKFHPKLFKKNFEFKNTEKNLKATADPRLWSSGVNIGYAFNNISEFTQRELDLISDSLEQFSFETSKNDLRCINFVPFTCQSNYILITRDQGCSVDNGRMYTQGFQTLSLAKSCFSRGTFLGLLMAVLGFLPEHSRPDRDEYITIVWENVNPLFVEVFDINNNSRIVTKEYDYSSLTHASQYLFTINDKKTVLPKKPNVIIFDLSQRNAPSALDIESVRAVYRCPE